jgi:hypothetical protein
MDICRKELPELERSAYGDDHYYRCHLDDETRTRTWQRKRELYMSQGAA